MKRIINLIRIIAFVTVIALSFVVCSDDNGSTTTKFEGRWRLWRSDWESLTYAFNGHSFTCTYRYNEQGWDIKGKFVYTESTITLTQDGGYFWTFPYTLTDNALRLGNGTGNGRWDYWEGNYIKQKAGN